MCILKMLSVVKITAKELKDLCLKTIIQELDLLKKTLII